MGTQQEALKLSLWGTGLDRPVNEIAVDQARELDRLGYVVLHCGNWSRIAEVRAYAEHRGMSIGDAIMHLVNGGLSHL